MELSQIIVKIQGSSHWRTSLLSLFREDRTIASTGLPDIDFHWHLRMKGSEFPTETLLPFYKVDQDEEEKPLLALYNFELYSLPTHEYATLALDSRDQSQLDMRISGVLKPSQPVDSEGGKVYDVTINSSLINAWEVITHKKSPTVIVETDDARYLLVSSQTRYKTHWKSLKEQLLLVNATLKELVKHGSIEDPSQYFSDTIKAMAKESGVSAKSLVQKYGAKLQARFGEEYGSHPFIIQLAGHIADLPESRSSGRGGAKKTETVEIHDVSRGTKGAGYRWAMELVHPELVAASTSRKRKSKAEKGDGGDTTTRRRVALMDDLDIIDSKPLPDVFVPVVSSLPSHLVADVLAIAEFFNAFASEVFPEISGQEIDPVLLETWLNSSCYNSNVARLFELLLEFVMTQKISKRAEEDEAADDADGGEEADDDDDAFAIDTLGAWCPTKETAGLINMFTWEELLRRLFFANRADLPLEFHDDMVAALSKGNFWSVPVDKRIQCLNILIRMALETEFLHDVVSESFYATRDMKKELRTEIKAVKERLATLAKKGWKAETEEIEELKKLIKENTELLDALPRQEKGEVRRTIADLELNLEELEQTVEEERDTVKRAASIQKEEIAELEEKFQEEMDANKRRVRKENLGLDRNFRRFWYYNEYRSTHDVVFVEAADGSSMSLCDDARKVGQFINALETRGHREKRLRKNMGEIVESLVEGIAVENKKKTKSDGDNADDEENDEEREFIFGRSALHDIDEEDIGINYTDEELLHHLKAELVKFETVVSNFYETPISEEVKAEIEAAETGEDVCAVLLRIEAGLRDNVLNKKAWSPSRAERWRGTALAEGSTLALAALLAFALEEAIYKSMPKSTVRRKNNDYCEECDLAGRLICCDACPRVYHLLCLEPPLLRAPPGDWTCEHCVKRLEREASLFAPRTPRMTRSRSAKYTFEDEEEEEEEEEDDIEHLLQDEDSSVFDDEEDDEDEDDTKRKKKRKKSKDSDDEDEGEDERSE